MNSDFVDEARVKRLRFREILARPKLTVWKVLNDFFERGPVAQVEFGEEIRRSKWGPVDQHKLVGLQRIREIEEQFLPEADRRDYENTWGHRSVLGPRKE